MKKKKKTSKAIKNLYLDRKTSHGGWPDGKPGSYTDPDTPVHKQISKYLEDMGLLDDSNPRAKLSENKLRALIHDVLSESYDFNYGFTPLANPHDVYEKVAEPNAGMQVKVIQVYEKKEKPDRYKAEDPQTKTYYHVKVLNHPQDSTIYLDIDRDTFHKTYRNVYMATRY